MIKFKKGKTYNRLTLIKDLGIIRGTRKFQCKCECGRRVSRKAYSVITGHTKSCGCLSKEISRQLAIERKKKPNKSLILYKRYKQGALRRGLEFKLTQKQFSEIVKKKCNYCGIINKLKLNGIDRVDNSRGYILDNCVASCKTCNISKWTLSKTDFLRMVDSVYKHSIKGKT